ncbi:multidrug ABC transporter ATP-binding protein [Alkalihalobacillus alcalophilus ATCC 27647 = CGMCC 1.3604]|nr:ABC transporter ATP-binding protein [Alkalihalobacillus alcalophilus]KGA98070.1 multidrug ABC transporter ATP-binding protein [Alkalihalobacillus alcalophilus ATCC 27647 = CGMCC 1.3604]MED1561044.1 ABC transporter ATP-binding protein [Alkalihalobacillus alcalophilus]THG88333.1 multidrug ABC transporter ATP-binding protein [Alkalihalobacillus alcalophilus ATCC 27647 = CGMCC 1.3604]
MTEVLKINQLTGGYHPKRPILHNVDFSVNAGEIVALIGLNGAGKSTTIKHILGLLDATSGSITINGQTFQNAQNTYRQSYAYIPETPILYDELTLWEHLELTSLAYGIETNVFKERAEQLLKEFKMVKMKKWFPSHFSKGMRQKVMIMSAFLTQPPVYIVDEPIVGLDPVGIQSFLDLISDVKNQGAAVLMSTHILATAERYCDRFVILHHGKVVLYGTLAEMRQTLKMPNATLDEIYLEMTKDEMA